MLPGNDEYGSLSSCILKYCSFCGSPAADEECGSSEANFKSTQQHELMNPGC